MRLGLALVEVSAADIGDILIDLYYSVVGDNIAFFLLLILYQSIF